jgi:hypothetical protein
MYKVIQSPAQQAHAFPRFDLITSPTVSTAQAAHYTNRKPQTLRAWACRENGPLRPVRVNGRLAWRVSDIRRVMEGK